MQRNFSNACAGRSTENNKPPLLRLININGNSVISVGISCDLMMPPYMYEAGAMSPAGLIAGGQGQAVLSGWGEATPANPPAERDTLPKRRSHQGIVQLISNHARFGGVGFRRYCPYRAST